MVRLARADRPHGEEAHRTRPALAARGGGPVDARLGHGDLLARHAKRALDDRRGGPAGDDHRAHRAQGVELLGGEGGRHHRRQARLQRQRVVHQGDQAQALALQPRQTWQRAERQPVDHHQGVVRQGRERGRHGQAIVLVGEGEGCGPFQHLDPPAVLAQGLDHLAVVERAAGALVQRAGDREIEPRQGSPRTRRGPRGSRSGSRAAWSGPRRGGRGRRRAPSWPSPRRCAGRGTRWWSGPCP